MTKTIKKNKTYNKTKKIKLKLKGDEVILRKDCPINLKPFEELFQKEFKTNKAYNLVKDQFVKILLSRSAPSNIQPQNDYYSYINYKWLSEISVQKQQQYIVQVDDFRLTQDRVYHELNAIILEYIKTHDDKLSKNLKNYYDSVVNMNSISKGKKICKKGISMIEELIASENPWKMLAHFNKYECFNYLCPFIFTMEQDDKNSKKFISNLNPYDFILLDLNVYYDDKTNVSYKNMYRKQFKLFCKKLFKQCLGENHGYNTDDIYDVEVDMFNVFGCRDVTKDEKPYNKVSREDALKKYGFNWTEFAKELGFKNIPEHFVTTNLNYLKCGTELFLQNWNSKKWKTYWIYILIQFVSRTTRKWETLNYNFFGKFEKGQDALNETDAVSASLYMSVPFNKFLTEKYVEKYANSDKIEYVRVLCEDLKKVFYRIMTNNKWLQNKTKGFALKNIERLKFMIGYPEHLRIDPDLNYNDNLFENIIKINLWRFNEFLNLEGKDFIDLPMVDWSHYPVKLIGDQAYIVNASYTPSKNVIYINLGYIQKPFIDLDERGIEYNLAHIGFTISHEMSHALDDWGSQYDYNGNLNDWWTPEDKKHFKLIQENIIKQYQEFAARDGIKFDASIGLGENMADISAIAICEQYLKDFQDFNKDLIPIRSVSYEMFYIFFAFQQKQKISKKAISAQLKTNPHPLDKYRCNVPLSRSVIFRALYNVKKGDGMWWSNTNTIW
jgi:putative endopeptidase